MGAACGGDDADVATDSVDQTGSVDQTDDVDQTDESADSTSTEDLSTTTVATASTPDPACPTAPFPFEVQLANEFAGEPTVPLGPITFVDAIALQLDDSGGAFTIYLADHDLDPDDFEGYFDEPTPGPDQTIVTAYITSFNATAPLPALEAGDVVEGTAALDTLTFNVIAQRGDAMYNSGNPRGTIEITAIDDSYLCATIDYADLVDQNDPDSAEQKVVRGSFTAPIILWGLAS